MILQHVTRERLPRGLHHPLKYADLEAPLQGKGAPRLYLSARFGGDVLREPPEHRTGGPAATAVGREYLQLARIHYHPQAHRVLDGDDLPWGDQDDPLVVFADVFPVEREVSQWLPALRRFTAQTAAAHVGKLAGNGLPGDRWLVHLALLPETSELEVGTVTWTDLRRNDERIERVPIS